VKKGGEKGEKGCIIPWNIGWFLKRGGERVNAKREREGTEFQIDAVPANGPWAIQNPGQQRGGREVGGGGGGEKKTSAKEKGGKDADATEFQRLETVDFRKP